VRHRRARRRRCRPGGREKLLGIGDYVGVDVNRGDMPVRAGQVREQRRVVSGARANFQHSVSRPDIELTQLHGHNPRVGQAAQDLVWGPRLVTTMSFAYASASAARGTKA
jgi:hypothetical protein